MSADSANQGVSIPSECSEGEQIPPWLMTLIFRAVEDSTERIRIEATVEDMLYRMRLRSDADYQWWLTHYDITFRTLIAHNRKQRAFTIIKSIAGAILAVAPAALTYAHLFLQHS